MRRVVTVSLNGTSYQIEEAGFEVLRGYLDDAEAKLGSDPDCAEILADLEQAIGEKCARGLDAHRNVVSTEAVQRALAEMGPVEGSDASGGAKGRASAGSTGPTANPDSSSANVDGAAGAPKRLYQISDGAMISGLCNGIAAYFNVDVAIVRVIFVILALLSGGAWILVYVVLMFVIPFASTSEDHAAAHGLPFTAQQLVKQAKRQYAGFRSKSKGCHYWQERHCQRRQWKRQWKRQWRNERRAMRAYMHWGRPYPPGEHAGYATQVLAGVFVPLAALINAVLVIALLIGIAQLVSSGHAFGWALPPGVPLWVGIVGLCILCTVLAAPLRAVRHAAWYAHDAGAGARGALVGSILWFAFVALLLWIAWNHWPQLQHLWQQGVVSSGLWPE